MWKKKFESARVGWEAAMAAAKKFATELEAKTETPRHERARLDTLIADVKAAKAEYDRLKPLAEMEEQQEALDVASGRKTRDNAAPGIIASGARGGTSRPLKISNIFKATFAAGSSHNLAVFREYANEEYAISERLKGLGYQSESMGGWLFPLGHELLIEPTFEGGKKQAEFEDLRREVKERLAVSVDPGEMGWMLKRFPGF